MQFLVEVNCRQNGAIGEFSNRTFMVDVDNVMKASHAAIDAAHEKGFEVNYTWRIRRYEKDLTE